MASVRTNGSDVPVANMHRLSLSASTPQDRSGTDSLNQSSPKDFAPHHALSTSNLPRAGSRTIKLRSPGKNDPTFHGPSPEWLSGKWHIVNSTLPTWKDKRNVTITYTMVSEEQLDDKVEFDPIMGGTVNSVSGRQIASKKSKNNHVTPSSTPAGSGKNSPAAKASPASSQPDITATNGKPQRPRQVRMNTVEAHELGQSANGEEEGEIVDWDWSGKGLIKLASAHWEILGWGGSKEEKDQQWVVTYFKKTIMTPEGLNIYARRPELIDQAFLKSVKEAIARLGEKNLDKLVGAMYATHRGP